MANKTANWTAAYEAIPPDANNVANGATRIRAMKVDVRERIAEDHYMDIAGNQADHGQHKQVTFVAPLGSDPTYVANKAILYTLTANQCDLYIINGANQIVQITKANAMMAFPANTVMAFGQDAAPTGWTRLTTGDAIYDAATDNAMFCFAKTGNIAQGGGVDPQAVHNHSMALHVHEWYRGKANTANDQLFDANGAPFDIYHGPNKIGKYAIYPYINNYALLASGNAYTDQQAASNTGNSTAPYYVEMILAKKD